LVILNGTAEPGLARDVSLALAAFGYVTDRIGNAPHPNYDHSLLINRRLSGPQTETLAQLLGHLDHFEENDSRTSEDAVLVLGADWWRVFRALGLPRGENDPGNGAH
jgi:hypothetical protein